MRILLVDPPCERFMGFYRFYYPLGLGYLAGTLRQVGHEVLILDAEHAPENISLTPGEASGKHYQYLEALENENHPVWREIALVVEDFKPDIVGVSCLTLKVASALQVVKITRQVRELALIVLGGDHVTALPEDGLMPLVDVVVRGEGETTFLEIVEAFTQGVSLTDIKGCSFGREGTIHHNPPRRNISGLDDISFPEISALHNLETYRPVDLGIVVSSRGCPYQCTFCGLSSIWGNTVRFRSPANVISEIDTLIENFKVNYISFRDGTFTLVRKRVLELCQLLSERNIHWECLGRCDLLDEKLLETMIKSGCAQIRLGIESGSPRMLEKMKKKLTLEQIRSSAQLLKKTEIYWSAFFMIGLPGEQIEDVAMTRRLIEEIDPPFVTLARWVPLPGTPMTEEAKRGGLLPEEIDWRLASNRHLEGSLFLKEVLPVEVVKEMAEFVKSHNQKHGLRDQRIKS